MFITETDTLGYGESVTTIKRYDQKGRPFDDGQGIVYVNGAWRGDDAVGRLMEDFSQPDSDKMHYQTLANRAQGIKNPEVVNRKEENMSEEARKVLEKYTTAWFADGKREGLTRTARAMLRDNMDVSLVSRCTSLPIEEVERLKTEPAT